MALPRGWQERVEAGESLEQIEFNESVKRYAPFPDEVVFDTSKMPMDSSDESLKLRMLLADYLKIWQGVLDSASIPSDQRGYDVDPALQMPLSNGTSREPFLWVNPEKFKQAEDKFKELKAQWIVAIPFMKDDGGFGHMHDALHPKAIGAKVDILTKNHIDDDDWQGISSIPLIKHGDYEPTRVLHSDREDTVWRGATEGGDYVNPFAEITPPWERIRSMVLKGHPQDEIMSQVLTNNSDDFVDIVTGHLNDPDSPDFPIETLLQRATLLNPNGVQRLLSGQYFDQATGTMMSQPKGLHEKILKYLPVVLNSARDHERMLGQGSVTSPKDYLTGAMTAAVRRTGRRDSLKNINLGWGQGLTPETNMLLMQRENMAGIDAEYIQQGNDENDTVLGEVLEEMEVVDPKLADDFKRHLFFDRDVYAPPRPLASKHRDDITYVPNAVKEKTGLSSQNTAVMTEDEKTLKMFDSVYHLNRTVKDHRTEAEVSDMTEEIREMLGPVNKETHDKLLAELEAEALYQELSTKYLDAPTLGESLPETKPISEASPADDMETQIGRLADINTGTALRDLLAESYRRSVHEQLRSQTGIRRGKSPDEEMERSAYRAKETAKKLHPKADYTSRSAPIPAAQSDPVKEWLEAYKFRHNKPGATQGWGGIKAASKAEARTLPLDYLKGQRMQREYTPNETASIEAVQAWTDILNNLK